VTILDFAEIEERRFAGWRMGNVDLNKINLSSILRYSERGELDPFSMSGRSALALLEELVSSGAIGSYDGSVPGFPERFSAHARSPCPPPALSPRLGRGRRRHRVCST
jgi:hypothetical protein